MSNDEVIKRVDKAISMQEKCRIWEHERDKAVAHFLTLDKEIKQLKAQLEKAESVLEMVLDNTKMPHKHNDPQLRLYCLTERASEYFSNKESK